MPEKVCALHEVGKLHGFMGIMRTILIGDEDHGDRDAAIAEHGRIVTRARGKPHDGEVSALGALPETVCKRFVHMRGRGEERRIEFEPDASFLCELLRLSEEIFMEGAAGCFREASSEIPLF